MNRCLTQYTTENIDKLATNILIEWESGFNEPSIATYRPDGDNAVVGQIILCAWYQGNDTNSLILKKQQLDIIESWLRQNCPHEYEHAHNLLKDKEARCMLTLETIAIKEHLNIR